MGSPLPNLRGTPQLDDGAELAVHVEFAAWVQQVNRQGVGVVVGDPLCELFGGPVLGRGVGALGPSDLSAVILWVIALAARGRRSPNPYPRPIVRCRTMRWAVIDSIVAAVTGSS